MFKKILVPLDGSKLAEKILPQVEQLVEFSQAEVVVVQVVQSYKVEPKEEREEKAKLTADAQGYLDKIAGRLLKKGVQAKAVVTYGKDAIQICDYARKNKFGLIAMSTHGRSGLSRWALGSVADKVVSCSDVPVMIFRAS
jgi:nucleotide-binding universal stress UspA family protein